MRIELDIPNEIRNKVTLTVHTGLDSSNSYGPYGLTPSSFVGYGHPYQPYKYDQGPVVSQNTDSCASFPYTHGPSAFPDNKKKDYVLPAIKNANDEYNMKASLYIGRLVKFEFDGKEIYGITVDGSSSYSSTIITLNTIATAPIYGKSINNIIDRLRSDLFADKLTDEICKYIQYGYEIDPYESVDLPRYNDIYGDKYNPLRPIPMAVECLRVAKSFDGEIQSYWLADSDEDGKEFMCVEEDGNPSTDMGSNARGIRVKFKITCDIFEKDMVITDPTEIESILCTAKPMK